MTESPRLYVLSLLVLFIGSAFALAGVLTGEQWGSLAVWVLGLHSAGTGVERVAKPFGELLVARAVEITQAASNARRESSTGGSSNA